VTAPTALARRALATFDELPISPRFVAGFLALVIAALAWLGWTWLRDSSLVRVDEVQVSGLTTRDAPAIRRTLRQAAMRMTTLNYSEEELRRAVEPFPAVESVSADSELPHKLVIRVREHRPVAALVSGDARRVAVASDGTLLPQERDTGLPAVKVDAIPDGGRLGKGAQAVLVRVVARAPEELRPLLQRAYRARDGVRVAVEGGPTLRFGAPIRLAAKWAAAARVLADTPAAGAEFLDLRIPERPSAAYGQGETGDAQAAAAAQTAAVQAAAGAVESPPQTFEAAPPETGSTGAAGVVGTAPAVP
jgi:cell division protein FtsQ